MKFTQLIYLFILFLACACGPEEKKLAQMEEYEGPSLESTNVIITMTDAARLKLVIKGKKQLTFKNGDLSFPETIRIDFFDTEGDTTSVLTAQTGSYDAKTKLYKATGDVFVRNLKEKQTLNTEELFWDPEKEIIFTERFFTIVTEDQLIKGEGLDAPQDFSSYVIKNVRDSEIIIREGNANN
jgi:LPS export ABC transporter protein LptC